MKPGMVIEFCCNGRGRGGHYHVAATITKVNPKTVKAIECNRSYSPGTRWIVYKDKISTVREPRLPVTCNWCKGTGNGGRHGQHRCAMCNNGTIPHESWTEK
jgi:hypothetical protein